VVLAIAWGQLGITYGLPGLFWHENVCKQILAGLGATLLFAEVCLVSYLLDADKGWFGAMTPPRRRWVQALPSCLLKGAAAPTIPVSSKDPSLRGELRCYFAITWLPLLIGLLAPVLLDPATRWPMAVGVLTAIIGVRLFVACCNRIIGTRIGRLAWLARIPGQRTRLHQLAAAAFGSFFVAYLMLFLLYWTPCEAWISALLSPFLALCLLFAVAVAIVGFLQFHCRRYSLLGLAVLALILTLANSFVDYRGRLAVLRHYYDAPQDLKRYQEALGRQNGTPTSSWGALSLLRSGKALEAWKARHGHKPKLVVIATSGGGIRAAAWTVRVLAVLERDQDLPGFCRHVRLVTGASGGIVGACYYVASLNAQGEHVNPGGELLTDDRLFEDMTADSLTAVANRFVLRDLPMLFVPMAHERDRGVALEEAWERHTEGTLAIPFRDLTRGEEEGWRPSLVLAPMLVEDGRRLLISNLDLAFLPRSSGSFLGGIDAAESCEESASCERVYSISAVEFFRLFPKGEPLKLSTAARLSASFPYVSPAAILPTRPRRHVTDAGYFDNYGVNLAAGWIYHHRTWLERNTSGVLLIQIRDRSSEDKRLRLSIPDNNHGWPWSRGTEWLTSPASSELAARAALMAFRNDEQLSILADWFNGREGRRGDFFTTVVFELPEGVALSWYLSRKEKEEVFNGLKTEWNIRSASALRTWWTAR
jgi:hypothetical protein